MESGLGLVLKLDLVSQVRITESITLTSYTIERDLCELCYGDLLNLHL